MLSGTPSLQEWDAAEKKRSARIFEKIKAKAARLGVTCATVSRQSAAPHKAILESAKKARCDLIVMASHGRRGIQALILGSETHKVLTLGKLPVLVCR
jgi:nucleotide-binding universal stress UspA family protein